MLDNTTVHVMVDIETTGIRPGCGVVNIGAVAFLPTGIIEDFESYVRPESNFTYGLQVAQSTMDWWALQLNRDKIFGGTTDIKKALQEFSAWYLDFQKGTPIWCCGTDFDLPILKAAMEACSVEIPWQYGDVRDYRTVRECFKLPEVIEASLKKDRIKHDALQDAIYQAKHLIEINRLMGDLSDGTVGLF